MNINIDDKTGKVTAFPETSLTPLEASSVPRQEAAHLEEKGKIIDKNLVAGLVKKSNRILISISTHRFPLDIFPDTLNVEEGRLTIINRSFFLSSQVHSVDIKDISIEEIAILAHQHRLLNQNTVLNYALPPEYSAQRGGLSR